jgi:hypothetical protein
MVSPQQLMTCLGRLQGRAIFLEEETIDLVENLKKKS